MSCFLVFVFLDFSQEENGAQSFFRITGGTRAAKDLKEKGNLLNFLHLQDEDAAFEQEEEEQEEEEKKKKKKNATTLLRPRCSQKRMLAEGEKNLDH